VSENFALRIHNWWNQYFDNLKKRAFWRWAMLTSFVWFVVEAILHRFFAGVNSFIDVHPPTLTTLKYLLFTLPIESLLRPLVWLMEGFLGGLFLLLVHAYWETRPSTLDSSSLLKRVRSAIKRLSNFVDENEGNVTAIHFLYDAKFRTEVDKLFSELAAEEVCDVVAGDWVINPQIQTTKNIRENIIGPLSTSADRLEVKRSAPRSKLVGELESGTFTVRGEGFSDGARTFSTNLCVKLRVTNREKIETTVKRANLRITVGGETYRGTKTSLWHPQDGKDLLEKITDVTPIRHGVATVGSLEFTIDGLKCPNHGVEADVTVTLIDEFDLPHPIRNKSLWIAA
jgi:hypothetical protein